MKYKQMQVDLNELKQQLSYYQHQQQASYPPETGREMNDTYYTNAAPADPYRNASESYLFDDSLHNTTKVSSRRDIPRDSTAPRSKVRADTPGGVNRPKGSTATSQSAAPFPYTRGSPSSNGKTQRQGYSKDSFLGKLKSVLPSDTYSETSSQWPEHEENGEYRDIKYEDMYTQGDAAGQSQTLYTYPSTRGKAKGRGDYNNTSYNSANDRPFHTSPSVRRPSESSDTSFSQPPSAPTYTYNKQTSALNRTSQLNASTASNASSASSHFDKLKTMYKRVTGREMSGQGRAPLSSGTNRPRYDYDDDDDSF